MPDLTALDDAIVDDDGYPTEAALALLPTWTGTPRALVEDLLDPIFAPYGVIRVDDALHGPDKPVKRIRVATGGWSGCEEALGDLKRGAFWFFYWQASARGGAYTFEVPVEAWEKPLIEWPAALAASRTDAVEAAAIERVARAVRAALDATDAPGSVCAAIENALAEAGDTATKGA